MTDAPTPQQCTHHPEREAVLECSACHKPICLECKAGTPEQPICARCATMPTEAGLAIERPQTPAIPWEASSELGYGSAFLKTFVGATFMPNEFWKSHQKPSENGPALAYQAIIAIFLAFVAVLSQGIQTAVVLPRVLEWLPQVIPTLDPAMLETIELELQKGAGSNLVMTFIFTPIFIFIAVFIVSSLNHLVLEMFGAANGDLLQTWRTAGYTLGAQTFKVVPVLGGVIAFFWLIVVRTIAYRDVHETSTGSAFLAVILPGLLLLCCCAIFIGGIVVLVMKAAGAA